MFASLASTIAEYDFKKFMLAELDSRMLMKQNLEIIELLEKLVSKGGVLNGTRKCSKCEKSGSRF